jgi:hypothetical protein
MTRKHPHLLSMLLLLVLAVWSWLATFIKQTPQQQVVLVPYLVISHYDDERNHSHAVVLLEPELLQPQQEEGEDEEEPPDAAAYHKGVEEEDDDADDDEPPISTNTNTTNTTKTNGIPPIVWMFWDDGWPASNPEANLALYSFRHCNKNDRGHDDTNDTTIQKWTIRPIDTITAERYSQRKKYIPDDDFFFSTLTVQARSDVYRTLLLNKYGGVWADASLFCNIPISEWLLDNNNNNNHTDLISLVRHDNTMQQQQLDIAPWITSWFLASPPRGYTISRLVEQYLLVDDDENSTTPPQQHDRLTAEYFWWHRMISELARSDERIAANIDTYSSADPSHCHTNDNTTTVPLYKRCKNKPMYAVMATTRYCCDYGQSYDPSLPIVTDKDDNNITNTNTKLFGERMQSLCAVWNCTGRPTDHLLLHGGGDNSDNRIATAWGTNDLSYFQSLFVHG